MAETLHEYFHLDQLRIDGETQARVKLDEDTVAEYAEAVTNGDAFPPLLAYFDGTHYWLADGFTRYEAFKRARLAVAEVKVRNGSLDEARWYALSANKTHGLRRSAADKRNAIGLALMMRPEMSDRAIADHVGVDHKTVATVRKEIDCGNSPVRTGRDGRTTNTSNICLANTSRQSKPNDKPDDRQQNDWGNSPVTTKRRATPAEQRPVDQLGNPIPDHLRDVFGDPALGESISELQALLNSLSPDKHIRRAKDRAHAHPYVLVSEMMQRLDGVTADLEAAIAILKNGAPYAICPHCGGDGCDDCRQAGYVPKWRYNELAEQDRLTGVDAA